MLVCLSAYINHTITKVGELVCWVDVQRHHAWSMQVIVWWNTRLVAMSELCLFNYRQKFAWNTPEPGSAQSDGFPIVILWFIWGFLHCALTEALKLHIWELIRQMQRLDRKLKEFLRWVGDGRVRMLEKEVIKWHVISDIHFVPNKLFKKCFILWIIIYSLNKLLCF